LPLLNLFASYHDAYGQYDEIRLLDPQGAELAGYRSDDRLDAAPVDGLSSLMEALKASDEPAAARYVRDRDGNLVEGKGIELINDVPADLPPAWADENRLQQILNNLIGNAIKFTEQGWVRVCAGVDDPVNRRVLRNQLSLQGYRVEIAADGRAALAWFEQPPASEPTPEPAPEPAPKQVIVLLDVMMPRMNGYELCRILRERFDANELPILFMTARTREQDVLQGFVAGGNDYLPKPFSHGELIARVHAHATLARRTDELRRLTRELERRVAERTQALAQANQALEHLAAYDGLTQVYNRRYLDDALQREWRREQRQHRSLAALMIDIDSFKEYNDAHGHQAGDRCLQRVAKLLQAQVRRGGDLVARYGGEEFCVLVQSDAEHARTLAEQIRDKIEQLAIPHPASAVADHVTGSIGVAALVPSDETDPGSLIKRADDALYQAKRRGRNRVSVYGSGTPEPA